MHSFINAFVIALSLGMSVGTLAQDNVEGQSQLYGDAQQPGYKFQTEISKMLSEDATIVDSIAGQSIFDNLITLIEGAEETNPGLADIATPFGFSAEAVILILENRDLAIAFVLAMRSENDLAAVIRTFFEDVAYVGLEKELIKLGVYLYPDFAQVIIDVAAEFTDDISIDEAYAAAIVALGTEFDISKLLQGTAAGPAAGPVELIATSSPLGAGIGAGGSGGGDTTGSNN
jgi:hypothetical protein